MGLDMYLTAERYFWESQPKPDLGDLIPEGYTVNTLIVEAVYWRKANQIHKWFVDNIQVGNDECRPHYVTREQLRELVETCKKALLDPTELPPQSGFFFGSTDIDEWYFANLNDTIEKVEKALAAFPEEDWDFRYCSSW